MELLDKAVSLNEVNGWFTSIQILQSIFLEHVIKSVDHALEVIIQFSTSAQSILNNDHINLPNMQFAITVECQVSSSNILNW